MNILLLGSGGRESALAWKIKQSPLCDQLYIAPGNGGTALYGTNAALSPLDFEKVAEFVRLNSIDMIVVGNEDPLVAGIADYFHASQHPCPLIVGPDKAGARLEASKDFAKEFMGRHKIPTAAYKTFTADSINDAYLFLETLKAPYVLKADGLAAGKGVIIVNSLEEAKESLREMLGGKFGASSRKVVIEEFLSGIECSVFALTDGHGKYALLPVAKDYKRIGEGDTGLNTGGMGAVSPVVFADKEFMRKVEERIVRPTVDGLIAENIDYRGFIFFGLINVEGNPMVIEYNVRMGDPETEVVMLRIKSDLVELMAAAAEGDLGNLRLEIDPRAAVTVMAVSGGYPETYAKGYEISGIPSETESMVVFHAGTAQKDETIVTSGGRVLAVSSYGATPREALETSYQALAHIHFKDMYFRRDIGRDLLALENELKK